MPAAPDRAGRDAPGPDGAAAGVAAGVAPGTAGLDRAAPEAAAYGPIPTARLLLRQAMQADAGPVAALMTDAISARLSAWAMPWTAARMAARIAEWGGLAARGYGMPCVVERRADGALVGWVHALVAREDLRRANMGWWCAEAHQGQGYIREAAAGLLPEAFRFLRVAVVEAGAQPDNHASFAVMRALGMSPVGERMLHAPARGRVEPVMFWEVSRGDAGA